jgi:hypothetical protein
MSRKEASLQSNDKTLPTAQQNGYSSYLNFCSSSPKPPRVVKDSAAVSNATEVCWLLSVCSATRRGSSLLRSIN